MSPNESLQIQSATFVNPPPMYLCMHLKNHNILLFCFIESSGREKLLEFYWVKGQKAMSLDRH